MSDYLAYADPLLWSQRGKEIPVQPGAVYHLDADAPPGLEAIFDSADRALPIGPLSQFQVPEDLRRVRLRMRGWRAGAPDLTQILQYREITPLGGSPVDVDFLRRVGFVLRTGPLHPQQPYLLSNAGPRFAVAQDGTAKIIPLRAFFTAAELASARSLVLEFDRTIDTELVDQAAPTWTSFSPAVWTLMRPGVGGVFRQTTQQKKLGGANDETASGAAIRLNTGRFVFTGPFSPLDSIQFTDPANSLRGTGTDPLFTLRLADVPVSEAITFDQIATMIVGAATTERVVFCVESDRLATLNLGWSTTNALGTNGMAISAGQTLTMSTNGYSRSDYRNLGVGEYQRQLIRAYGGFYALLLDNAAGGSNVYVRDSSLTYVEHGPNNYAPGS